MALHERPVIRLSDDSDLALPALAAAAVEPGQADVLGIRPEHLSIGADGLTARVTDHERLGAETRVFARAGEQDMTCVLYGAASPALDEAIALVPGAA